MSNFLALTIFSKSTNQGKVTFFSARTSPIFPTSLAKWNMCTSLWFHVRERPEKYFVLSAWCRELCGSGPRFLLFDKHEYIHGIFWSVILVSVFMLQVYVTFSLFLKIWLTESILVFREWLFIGTCFLFASNTLHHKFFLMKTSSLHCAAYTCKEKLWWKVAGECQMS